MYKESDPGIVFNLYGSFTSYSIPGPAVWDESTAGASSISSSASVILLTTVSAVKTTSQTPTSTTKPTVTQITSTSKPTSSQVSSTLVTIAKPSTFSTSVSIAPIATGVTAKLYGQWQVFALLHCSYKKSSNIIFSGGTGFAGPTTCLSGAPCKVHNPYHPVCECLMRTPFHAEDKYIG